MPYTLKDIEGLTNLSDFVHWGAKVLDESDIYFGHGTDNALDESLVLVLHVLKLPFGFSEKLLQLPLEDDERQKVLDLVNRRIEERIPAAYITNEGWFLGMPFYVDERVLVPRSPIAELIESAFVPWINAGAVNNILDMCTGSGCIAIACAHAFPAAKVDASDISADVLEVTNINIERHELQGRVHAIQSDVFDNIPAKRYDIIVSNPPYVDAEDMASMPAEFHAEPALGLAAGSDGLDIVRRMLAQAADYLSDDGILVVEVGNSAAAVETAWPQVPFMWLEFEHGGSGVFLLTAAQLNEHKSAFNGN